MTIQNSPIKNKYQKALIRRDRRLSTFIKWIEAIKEEPGYTDEQVTRLLIHHFDFLMTNLIKDSEEIL
jgi:hypothetical protein